MDPEQNNVAGFCFAWNGIIERKLSMKIMCYCGKEISYETPFQDFSTRRVPCGPSCRSVQAIGTAQRQEARPDVSPQAFNHSSFTPDFLRVGH